MTANKLTITFPCSFFKTLLRAVCCTVLCFLWCHASCVTCYGADNSVSVKDCLDAYERYLANFESCSFLFHEHVRGEDIQAPSGRFESTPYSVSYFVNKKNSQGDFLESIERNYSNGRKIHINKSSKTDTIPDNIFRIDTLSTDDAMAGDSLEAFRSDLSFSVLFGYLSIDFSKNEKISDIILKNNFTARTVTEDNVVNVLCEGSAGKVRLGFSFTPDYGYALTKITLTNESTETVIGYNSLTMTFGDFLRYDSDPVFFFPRKIDTSYVGTATFLQQDEQGKVIKVPYTQPGKWVCSLSNFKANNSTEKELPLLSNVDDGMKVFVQDAPHIEHIWHDGKIVPKTDELALERARGHGFMPGPDEPRFWLMGIGIGLILFACGKKTYDYFKNRKDK